MSCKDVQKNVPCPNTQIHHSEENKSRKQFEVTLLNNLHFYSLLRVENVKNIVSCILMSKHIPFDSLVSCSFDWLHDEPEGIQSKYSTLHRFHYIKLRFWIDPAVTSLDTKVV